MEKRLIAIARLIAALAVIWVSIANAAGFDVLAFVEVLKYGLTHPETLLASFLVGIAWWYNEDITDKAILNSERNKTFENDPADFGEDEGEEE